jgi:hypothetical protein
MNVEIGVEAALFPGKEYIIGIAVAVWVTLKKQDFSYRDFSWVKLLQLNRFL